MDPIDDERYDEIEALLHAVQEYCNEGLTGVPANVPNPIANVHELYATVQRVHELIQTITPGQDNRGNM